MKLRYKYYVCRCGRKIIPVSNPSKCPHCGRVTILKWGTNMYKQNEHVTKRGDGKWQVIGEGNKRASAVTDTQAQAIVIGRDLAIKNKSELLIHGENGRIREKNSYGNDPFPPKG